MQTVESSEVNLVLYEVESKSFGTDKYITVYYLNMTTSSSNPNPNPLEVRFC